MTGTGEALEISMLSGVSEAQLNCLATKFVQLLGAVTLHIGFVSVDEFFVLTSP